MNLATADKRALTRWQAAGLHLLVSAVIAAAVLAVMITLWYPPPLFVADGGTGLLTILVGVDVTLGPLITLVIFRAGKPGLKFDLSVIGVLQVSALVYGAWVVFEARPVFIVFVKDQFEIVRAVELEPKVLAQARRPEYRTLPLTGPVLAAVAPPTDPKEREDLLFSALQGGKDMQHIPKYYVPYAERAQEVVSRGRTLQALRGKDSAAADAIEGYLAQSGRREADVLFVPLRTRRGWIAAVVDARSGELVTMVMPSGGPTR